MAVGGVDDPGQIPVGAANSLRGGQKVGTDSKGSVRGELGVLQELMGRRGVGKKRRRYALAGTEILPRSASRVQSSFLRPSWPC